MFVSVLIIAVIIVSLLVLVLGIESQPRVEAVLAKISQQD